MRCLVLMMGLFAGCENPAPSTLRTTEPDRSVKAIPKKAELMKKEPPRINLTSEPTVPMVKTFDEAWAEAIALGRELDQQEPEATKKALAVLTGMELLEARVAIDYGPMELPENHKILTQLGLKEVVGKFSRKIAQQDGISFKRAAAIIWDPELGEHGILKMMNRIGTLEVITRVVAYKQIESSEGRAAFTDETRDSLIAIGAEKWLRR